MPTSPRPSVPHLLLLAGATLALGSLAFFGSTVGNLLYLAVVGLAAVAACRAGATAVPAARRIARIGAASVVLYALGDLAWWVVTWAGGSPDPSVADLAYLASYGALGAVLVLMLMPLHSGRWGIDTDVMIDILSVVTVSVLVLWELLIRDSVLATDPSAVIYPVLDAILLGLTVRVVTHARTRRRAGLLVAAALVCLLLGDYGYLDSTTGLVARISDALWMVAVLLLACAVVRLSRLPPAAADIRSAPSNASRLALAIGPLAVPLVW